MEKGINDEIIYYIDSLNIDENLKNELYYFNEKMKEIIKIKCTNKFDIIIDNMSKENINCLLEYTTNIIEKYGLYSEFIKYRNDIRELKDVKNSVIVVDEFNIFEDRILDSWNFEEKFNNFFTNLKLNNNMIILTCTDKIENHLKEINNSIFNLKLCIRLKRRETNKELYKKIISRYNEKNIECKLSYNTFVKIIDSFENNYYIKHFDIVDYIYDYSIKKMILANCNIINNKMFSDIIEKDKNKKETKNNSIDLLIGLDNIKRELDSLYNYLEFSKKLKNKNSIYLNMFFLGNPGTGKTTVARLYAEKLYELGYIKESKVIEITPNDLMGKYVGHTKDAIRKVFNDASGGILFIDEAYLIDEDVKKDIAFMKEALIELLKYLEDPKNIVIFAGYQDKMRNLYNNNPGIKSRIYKEIVFEDYTCNELYEILTQDLEEKGLKVYGKSKDEIMNFINKMKKDTNFGNARSIKQLSQKMIMNHANKKLEEDNLFIDSSDLPKEEKINTLRMGFGIYD